jgi:crossover junction endodeoxyribonuclease RuvC
MNEHQVAAIDPGSTGALAIYTIDTEDLVVYDCPVFNTQSKREINGALLASYFETLTKKSHVFIEQAQSMPNQGISGCFSYATGYGIYLGIIFANKLPHTKVRPNIWKKEFNLGKDKDKSRMLATQLFPRYAAMFERKKDHGRAEAALLALYGARKLGLAVDRDRQSV